MPGFLKMYMLCGSTGARQPSAFTSNATRPPVLYAWKADPGTQ